ncbi:unnamed protein product [Sphenostylis stenocarpa]|uniref:Uncharacterized protein n=1 Tax=Sphenostylis stenocarpa TaxID=92480 RepID=A0AA86SK70_9FABA|nr:unnamed protein product [Sphenostylis stenocarpa]
MAENFDGLTNKLPELKLDSKQAQGFLSFFKTLSDDPRAVRLFDRRDYYTAHGENATFVAKTYYHTTAMRQLCMEHLVNIGSVEDILFSNSDMQDSPVVVALSPNYRENGCTIELGFVDRIKRVLRMAEFLDDSHFTNVESALVALGCKGCLLPIESGKSTENRMFWIRSRILAGLLKGPIEPVRDLVSRFELAPGALGALLSYAELLADGSNYENYTLIDVEEINSRLDIVQAFVEDTVLRQDLRQHLKRISDIERLSTVCRSSELVCNILYLEPLELWTDNEHLNKFIGVVEASVDLDQLENWKYMISPSYDSTLANQKEQQESLENQIHKLHRQTADDLDLYR